MEENVSNALLMAAAMLIFIIAVSIIFPLISQTKETSDHILYSYDDTKYYEEGYEGITYTLADEKNVTRTVTMETIMPTVYRYIKEHYGVTIFDKQGNIIARFDETTESIVNNWPNYLRDAKKVYNQEKLQETACYKHYEYLKNIAVAAGFTEEQFKAKYRDYEALDDKLWKDIYGLDKKSGNTAIKYGTPWLGDEAKIAKRLDVDFGGGTAKYASGDHIVPVQNSLLNKYNKTKFKEIFLFVSDDSGKETDEETGDSVIIKANTTKLEIIYVMED